MAYFNLSTQVYKKIFSTLYAHTKENGYLSYVRTIQSRFFPVRGGELEHKELYPFIFLCLVEQGSESIHAMPNIVQFQTQLGIAVMQYNDGDVNLHGQSYSSTYLDSEGVEQPLTGDYPDSEVGYKVSSTPGSGFIDNSGEKKGIIEIIEDVKSLLYNKHKLDQFGIEGIDWSFAGVSDPTTTSLQPLLLSPYIEAKQININVRIIEDRNREQLGD